MLFVFININPKVCSASSLFLISLSTFANTVFLKIFFIPCIFIKIGLINNSKQTYELTEFPGNPMWYISLPFKLTCPNASGLLQFHIYTPKINIPFSVIASLIKSKSPFETLLWLQLSHFDYNLDIVSQHLIYYLKGSYAF